MNEEIFRKKNLDKVRSPESLDDYIKVTNPGVWLFIAGVAVLLAGAIVWGIFGRIESNLPAIVYVENGEAACLVTTNDPSVIEPGIKVRFGEYEAEIAEIGETDDTGCICLLALGFPCPDGYYDALAVVEYAPLSFIVN